MREQRIVEDIQFDRGTSAKNKITICLPFYRKGRILKSNISSSFAGCLVVTARVVPPIFYVSGTLFGVAIVAMYSPIAAAPDFWEHASYGIKVRGIVPVYVWGSAGLKTNLSFTRELILHLRNDPLGEAVTFGTEVATGGRTAIGTLQPSEVVSIALQNISGVFATCLKQSTVSCLIKG